MLEGKGGGQIQNMNQSTTNQQAVSTVDEEAIKKREEEFKKKE